MITQKIYLHSSKETNYEAGVKMGLVGEALALYTFACCEVEVIVEVEDDGLATIIECDGKKLEKEKQNDQNNKTV